MNKDGNENNEPIENIIEHMPTLIKGERQPHTKPSKKPNNRTGESIKRMCKSCGRNCEHKLIAKIPREGYSTRCKCCGNKWFIQIKEDEKNE